MNLVLAFHKNLRISEFQREIVPLRVNKESSLVGSMTHEMHLRRRHGLVTHWNCGQRRSGAGLRDLARSTSDCSIEIFHFWESLESLNNYLWFYDVLQHVLHYCLEISGKISVVKVFPPHEILGQVRFLSPEGQFSWGTRVWEHRMNPSFIKQAGCWLGEESTMIIFLNCLELYKPWWMACKERAADLRDHIYLERCGIVKKRACTTRWTSHWMQLKSLGRKLFLWQALWLCSGKSCHMAHVQPQICLLQHSAFIAEAFWISTVSIMAN